MMTTENVAAHTWAHLLSYCGQKRKRMERSFLIKRLLRMSADENRDIYPNFDEPVHYQRSGEYQTVISTNIIVHYPLEAFNNIICTQKILNS